MEKPQMSDIENMMNIIKTFHQSNTAAPPQDAEETVSHAEALSTPFDESIQTPALKALKAAIPFFDAEQQRKLGIMTKLIEIQNIMKMQVTIAATTNNRQNILAAMRPYIQKDKQQQFEMILKVMQIKEMMDVINSGGLSNEQ